ncbi:integumentary mucin C.1-like [Polypterus senegalus]|uniref:integumentary mucin C.1-like n=1 Tax=Polypterus senegalus TaxID=55291 RepID=UPI0019624E6E|nr:integumentary mucin C.1-like [Polypterus senegalus]
MILFFFFSKCTNGVLNCKEMISTTTTTTAGTSILPTETTPGPTPTSPVTTGTTSSVGPTTSGPTPTSPVTTGKDFFFYLTM